MITCRISRFKEMEMDFDYGIEPKNVSRKSRYNFDQISAGASLHVRTNRERISAMAAFTYWLGSAKPKPSEARSRGAYAKSEKVGDEDPKGPGYRIFFLSRSKDAAEFAAKTDPGKGDI